MFGLSCAPAIFNRISVAIARMMRRKGFVVIPYLDDFLVTSVDQHGCAEGMRIMVELLRKLGFPISWEKVTGPSRRIQFLGLVFSSQQQKIILLEDKLKTLQDMAKALLEREKVTKLELQK